MNRLLLALGLTLALLGSVAPVAAQDADPGCASALGDRGFDWAGETIELGTFGDAPAVACVASGPLEKLPNANRFGCLVVGGQSYWCTGFLDVSRDGDTTLKMVAHDSAATVDVSELLWTGDGFELQDSYLACAVDPTTPVDSFADCVAN